MRKLTEEEVRKYVEDIKENGFAVMEDAIDDAFQAEIHGELDRLQQVRPGGDIPPGPFTGIVTRRWFDVLNDGEVWQRVAVHPWIMQVQEEVLGEGFLLSTMGSAVIGPGEPAQAIHVDDGVYAFRRPHPNLVSNTMWALTDFTEETGATRVVPGSNNWDRDPDMTKDPSEYDTIPLLMPKGSIAFMVGTLYHGAGHNASDHDRVALTINYCNGSMRQQENLMMATSPTRMLGFSEELRNILGFKTCVGAGHMMAQDPAAEMRRRYSSACDPFEQALDQRNILHAKRLAARQD